MFRTGYQRRYYKASEHSHGGAGPAYWLQVLTIGTYSHPRDEHDHINSANHDYGLCS